jgi:hypothetical protein
MFNNFFAEQCKIPNGSVIPVLPAPVNKSQSELHTITVTTDDVLKILSALKVNKSSGPDGISPFILKQTRYSIAEPLARLFNYSLTNGVFPDKWKLSHITPVHKNGEKQLVSNYRPISLLSCVSKVLERIVYKHIYNYCTVNGLLTPKNSGFKQNDCTINQLLHLVQQIYDSLENGKDACMVFLDVSKAFDRVWHDGLYFKLQQIGISGSVLLWLKSYLHNRSQKVVLSGTASDS